MEPEQELEALRELCGFLLARVTEEHVRTTALRNVLRRHEVFSEREFQVEVERCRTGQARADLEASRSALQKLDADWTRRLLARLSTMDS